jgi:two-component system chemotaxis response regulator CheV
VGYGADILEVGENAFELIEFTVTRPRGEEDAAFQNGVRKPIIYGVNVAKVREVIRLPDIMPCLTTCPEVRGLCNLRGLPVPVVHLAQALGYTEEPICPTSQMIVTEFNGKTTGFVVAATRRIRRVGWDKVVPPTSDTFRSITGMIPIENGEFLFMLDFEQILKSIDGKSGQSQDCGMGDAGAGEDPPGFSLREKSSRTVMVVDDSPVARRAITNLLKGRGVRVVEFSDGEQAWTALRDTQLLTEIGGRWDAVVSDVEMPRLDGYSLVKRIREDKELKGIPVILHSSLSGDNNRERAKIVGADAYVQKFNNKEILEALRNAFGEGNSVKDVS